MYVFLFVVVAVCDNESPKRECGQMLFADLVAVGDDFSLRFIHLCACLIVCRSPLDAARQGKAKNLVC